MKLKRTAGVLILLAATVILPSMASARFVAADPAAGKHPRLSPYIYCANNPLKYVDPDGREQKWRPRFMSTDYWNSAIQGEMYKLRTTMAKGAPYVHNYWTVPHRNNAGLFSSMAVAGIAAGEPVSTSIGGGGGLVSELLALLGVWVEYYLDPNEQTASDAGWETLQVAVVDGVEYVLKASPAGQVAWWIVDVGGQVIRRLTPQEAEQLGLDGDDSTTPETGSDDPEGEEEDQGDGQSNDAQDTFTGWEAEFAAPPY